MPEKLFRYGDLRQRDITAGNTILIASEPRTVTAIEGHLRTLRSRYHVSQRTLAKEAKMTHGIYKKLETKRQTPPDGSHIDNLVEALGFIAPENDHNAVSAVTLLTHSQMDQGQSERVEELVNDAAFKGEVLFETKEHRSKRAAYKDIVLRSTTYGKAVRRMRQYEGLSIPAYATLVGVSASQIEKAEADRYVSQMRSVNLLIETTPFQDLDPYAQLMRLLSQRVDLWYIKQVAQEPFGKTVHYLRTAHGLDQEDLGKILHVTKSTVANIELYNNTPYKIDEGIGRWLGDDPMVSVLQDKLNGKLVSEDALNQLNASNYVFLRT